MAHAWKACWVKALGGSNPPFSANLSKGLQCRSRTRATTSLRCVAGVRVLGNPPDLRSTPLALRRREGERVFAWKSWIGLPIAVVIALLIAALIATTISFIV